MRSIILRARKAIYAGITGLMRNQRRIRKKDAAHAGFIRCGFLNVQKVKAFRSAKYLRWVKSLPCCICGGKSDDAHHIIGVGNHSGMGMKAPDDMVMPVCRADHRRIHETPEVWMDQYVWIGQTRAKAVEAGWVLDA